jgi:hypothetical protein
MRLAGGPYSSARSSAVFCRDSTEDGTVASLLPKPQGSRDQMTTRREFSSPPSSSRVVVPRKKAVAMPRLDPAYAKPERVCRTCWLRHGPPVLLPALLLVALTPDVPLIERDVTRSITSVAMDPAPAWPRAAVASVLAPPPALSGSTLAEQDGTPQMATVGSTPAPTPSRAAPTSTTNRALVPGTKKARLVERGVAPSAANVARDPATPGRAPTFETAPPPATVDAPSVGHEMLSTTSIAPNASPELSRRGPMPVPGLGPAQSIREAQFIERDGTLYVGNVPPPRGRDRGPRQSAGPGQDRGISVGQRSPRREPWHLAAGRTNLPASKT